MGAQETAAWTLRSTLHQISKGSCSTHPGLGKLERTGAYPRAIIWAASSTSNAVVPVVPWSIERIKELGASNKRKGTVA